MRALVILGIVVAGLLASNVSAATSPAPSAEQQVLDPLRGSEVPVQMNFRQVELGKVLEALGSFGPFKVEIDEKLASRAVTVEIGKVPLWEALTQLGRLYGLEFEVPSPSLLVVKARVKT